MTADRSSRVISEVCRSAARLIAHRFTVQMEYDPEHAPKAATDFSKAMKLSCQSLSRDI